MLFGVENDSPNEIVLYLIPDAGGTVPSVVVRSAGVELLRLPSNRLLPHIQKAGRHSTGQCGFQIDTELIPDLESRDDLEVFEEDTGLLVYRRFRPGFSKQRIFRLETHLLPLWRFDEGLKDHFQYWFKGLDRYGRETALQTFNLINTESSYGSGRLLMRMVERHIASRIKAIAIIRDPYEELAERLIVLKNVGEQRTELLGSRDAVIFEDVIAALDDVAELDGASCKRFFKRTNADISKKLSSPLVRQLTVANPSDPPPATAIGLSLQILAQFVILGLRSQPEHFSDAVCDLLDMPPGSLPVMRDFGKVVELGGELRQIREAESLLEQDLEIYNHMEQAFGLVEKAQLTE